MSKFSQFVPGVKPVRVAEYPSGTNTFTPTTAGNFCRVTIISGGSGGAKPSTATSGAGGGCAGATAVYWVRVNNPVTVVVGAGGQGSSTAGAAGSIGGASLFGGIAVNAAVQTGGGNPVNNNGEIPGGMLNATNTAHLGWGAPGGFAGVGVNGNPATNGPNGGGAAGTGAGSGGGGGGHLYGVAGAGGNAGSAGNNATGFGAGGGGSGSPNAGLPGGNGAGGLVIVEEFGS